MALPRLRARIASWLGQDDALRPDAPPLLDLERLSAVARTHRDAYAAADPFPHAVIDGLFDEAVLERVRREFATERPGSILESLPRHVAQKRSVRDDPRNAALTPFVRFFLAHLNSIFFLGFLSELSGIPDLISDPYFDGAGLHETLPGGWLDVHADFNFHGASFLDRRLNVLVYLNRDWRDDWGGELELWDRARTRCDRSIAPVLDRLVVLAYGEDHWHGHPSPLRCPDGHWRAVVTATYYAARAQPGDDDQAHGAIWAP